MSFSIRLLGGASVEGPDGPLTGRAAQRHRLALLALLATASRGGATRDKLIGYLWADSTEERARRALSDSVYRINKAVGVEAVSAVGEELRLDPARLPSDVARFRRAIEQRDWEHAVDLYAGPFLDGFHLPNALEFERWLDATRQELARQHADALEALADDRARAGDVAGAAAAWQARAALDRLNARIAVRLMGALEAAGDRAGALRHARLHAQLLEAELATGPDPEVEAAAARLRAGPLAGTAGALAAAADAAAGRSEEAVAAAAAIRGEEAAAAGRAEGEAAAATVRPGEEAAAADTIGAAPDGAAPKARSRPLRTSPAPRRTAARVAPRSRAGLVAVAALLGVFAAWAAWEGLAAPPPPARPGIAVLPFDALTPDAEGSYFADGVTEDVLTRLSMIEELRVIAPASVMPYRNADQPAETIAEELGVRYLLRGSVRRSNEDVRITAQLVDVRTSTNVWAQTYDRRLEDIFAVQGDIARRVASSLATQLAPGVEEQIDRAPTEDLTAYNLYLRGRFQWHLRTEAGLLRSAEFFRDATERDPSFARAWAGLADAYAVLAFYDYLPPGEAYPKAEEAARRALELDAMLAEPHASLGYITLYHGWDAAEAEEQFRRAIELNPSYSVGHQWYANHLVATGRFREAEREMSRAREVNPLSLIANGALGWVYYYAGRYEEAVRQCDLALEMDPDWDLGHLWRGMALEGLGRMDEALASLERARELSGGSGITLAALAHAHAVAGAPEPARTLLGELLAAREEGRYRPSFEIAKVYVALDRPAEALRWLERAYEEHSHSMVFLEVDPQLAPLADDPGFRALVTRVGFAGSDS